MKKKSVLTKISFIYFVGIKGVGMASLAVIANQAGLIVRGSDVSETFITDAELAKDAISVDLGFEIEAIRSFLSNKPTQNTLVIVTAAHGGFLNPQAVWASENGYKVISHGQAVGEFMRGKIFDKEFIGISVAGSHGKTTTSAMIATYLSQLGCDPTFTIGTSTVHSLDIKNEDISYSAGHFGKGDYFIAEADEYISDLKVDLTPKLLYQNPTCAIINNIDFDRPDYYKDIEQIKKVYISFIKNIKKDGALIINGDDPYSSDVIPHVLPGTRVITYGKGEKNMFQVREFVQDGVLSHFYIYKQGVFYANAHLNVIGEHNAINCLSAVSLLDFLGFSPESIAAVLPSFMGVERRIQVVGETKKNALIIDDYAHHPKEVAVTLRAIKSAYPTKRIVCIFQPHTYSRFEKLLDDFSRSFSDADYLILLPIYGSARESYSTDDHASLSGKFQNLLPRSIMLAPNQVVEYVHKHFENDFVIVTMGAGDVYKISQNLIVKSQN